MVRPGRVKFIQQSVKHKAAKQSTGSLLIVLKIFLKTWVNSTTSLGKDGSTKRVRYVGTVRLFCNGTGTVRWYGTPFL